MSKTLLLASVVTALAIAGPASGGEGARTSGAIDGLWTWSTTATPDGLTPNCAWSGAASTPSGDIYFTASDHLTNSALYRLPRGTNPIAAPGSQLSYVGDARAASEAVGNWSADDVAEKFHTRPLFYNGYVYMTTLNYSPVDSGYLGKNGFHWYAYDTARNTFSDLSAADPTGAGAEHGGLLSLTVDPARGILYGAMNPTGDIYSLDTSTLHSRRVGRPDYGRYVYPGRTLWTDQRGRVYFTAGNGAGYDPAVFGHVYFYDRIRGFGQLPTWQLNIPRAIDAKQCFPGANVCYLTDDTGYIYKFTDPPGGSPTWTQIGNIGQTSPSTYSNSWVFQVSPHQDFIYFLTKNGTFFQYDIANRRVSKNFKIATYDKSLAKLVFYGHDAWDLNGRFYIAAFNTVGPNMMLPKLLAIDPVRLLAAVKARGG